MALARSFNGANIIIIQDIRHDNIMLVQLFNAYNECLHLEHSGRDLLLEYCAGVIQYRYVLRIQMTVRK